jgi:hypothetical protein
VCDYIHLDIQQMQEDLPPPVAELQEDIDALNAPFPLGIIVRCAIQERKGEMQLIGFVEKSDCTDFCLKFLRCFS